MATSYPVSVAQQSDRFARTATRSVLPARPAASPANAPEAGVMKQFLTALIRSLAASAA